MVFIFSLQKNIFKKSKVSRVQYNSNFIYGKVTVMHIDAYFGNPSAATVVCSLLRGLARALMPGNIVFI